MNHPLLTKIERVRRLARRVAWSRALAVAAAAVLAAVAAVGMVDWLIGSEDHGLRLLLSLAVVGVIGLVVWRCLRSAWTRRLSLLDVARRIEQRWPSLQDRLSSSLQFLSQEEGEQFGSADLRRRVVTTTTAQLDGQTFREIVAWNTLKRPLIALGMIALVVAALFVASPFLATRAMSRLALPLSDQLAWPRTNNLALIHGPEKVAYGDIYRVEVTDRNERLPDVVKVFYWMDGQDESAALAQPHTMTPSGNNATHQLGRVTKPFQFKVVGGDDDTMPWRSVEVVEPPKLTDLKIQITPPEYTGWPATDSGEHLRAIEGSEVVIVGSANVPLTAARVVLDGEGGEEELVGSLHAEQLTNGSSVTDPLPEGVGTKFFNIPTAEASPWILANSGRYRLEIEAADGVVGGADQTYDIQVVSDEPPRVVLSQPTAAAFATMGGVVKVRGRVGDDLAIHRIELRYTRSDQSERGEQAIVLYVGPDEVERRDAWPESLGGEADSQEVAFDWELSKLDDLQPGTVLQFTLAAGDYHPQESISPAQRVTVISPQQLADRIGQRQAYIIGQLAEALRLQRDARGQTAAALTQLDETKTLTQADVVALQSTELNQRQVTRLLADEQDGVLVQIDALLDVVAANRLDQPQIVRRMNDLKLAVQQIVDEPLPEVERQLITGLKAGQEIVRRTPSSAGRVSGENEKERPSPPPRPEGEELTAVRTAVTAAAAGQDDVIARLEQLLGGLTRWDNYRRFARELGHLRDDQEQLAEETAAMRPKTLSQSVAELSPQQRADLAKLSQRQLELSRTLEKTLGRMRQMRQELESNDPLAAQALADTLDTASRLAPATAMRQAAEQTSENQLGQAADQQTKAAEQLGELLDALAGRREHELDRLVDKLREAVDDLGALREQHDGLRKKQQQTEQQPNSEEKTRQLQRLQREQQRLQEEAEKLARRLQRLRAEKAADKLNDAAEGLDGAGQGGDQGDSEQQRQQVQRDLEEAEAEARQALAQAERDLLDEQLARLPQALEALVTQQQTLLTRTAELETQRQRVGELSRGQQAAVKVLARLQRGLIDETNVLADKIAAAEVFHLGLTRAVDEMTIAAARMERGRTDDETQAAQRRAETRLVQLIEALQDDPAEPSEQPGGDGPGGPGGQQPDGIRQLAQIKLIRLMLVSVKQRSAALAEETAGRPLDAEEREQLDQLAQEYRRLTDLWFDLSEPVGDNPEDDPDSLPSIEPDLGGVEADELEKALRQSDALDLIENLPFEIPEGDSP